MAHVELPQEELDPIVNAIEEAFKPLTQAMPLIAKIPEEIKRLADNMSEDLSSGIPEKIDETVEKLTQDEAEMQLRQALSEAEQEALKELVDQLKLLRENGIPAEIKDGKVVKLTEEEIKITQQSYITTVKTLENLEKQKEEIVKSNLSADESAEALKNIQDLMDVNNQTLEDSKVLLANNLPEVPSDGPDDGPTPRRPRIFGEMKSAGSDVLGAPMMAFEELKNSFVENVGGPIKDLIGVTKKQHEEAMGYAETGEKADKISILKFIVIATALASILNFLGNMFGGGETMEEKKEREKQTAIEDAKARGDDDLTAQMRGEQAEAKVIREGFFDLPGILGLRDEATDITTEEGFKNRLDAKKKQIADAETQTALSEYGQQFSQGQSIVNIINQNNTNNTTQEGPTITPGASTEKPTALKTG